MPSKKRRHRVSNLDILLGPVPKEQVVVGEGLQPGGLLVLLVEIRDLKAFLEFSFKFDLNI